MSFDYHRAIVARMDEIRIVAVAFEGANDTFELPGDGAAAGIEKMPGDIDLEGGVGRPVDHVLITREIHHLVVIPQDGAGGSPKNGDFRFAHTAILYNRKIGTKSVPL